MPRKIFFTIFLLLWPVSVTFSADISRLLEAAKKGDTAAIRTLIADGININDKDDRGLTALMAASSAGHKATVQWLVEKGADITARDRKGQSAFSFAIQNGHPEIGDFLLDSGYDAKNNTYDLILACQKGYFTLVGRILEAGIDVTDTGAVLNRAGAFVFNAAVGKGRADIVKRILEYGIDVHTGTAVEALFQAAINGQVRVVKALLEKGVSPNVRGKIGQTALFYAAQKGRRDTALILIEHGADINAKTVDGYSILMAAAEYGQKDIVELLTDKDVKVNAKDDEGATALMTASEKGDPDIAALLLEKGADVLAMDEKGKTAFCIAKKAGHQETVQLLKSKGGHLIDEIRMLISTNDVSGLKRLMSSTPDLNMDMALDDKGKTALHHAVISGRKEITQLLLEKKADKTVRDETGMTPLHWAVYKQAQQPVTFLIKNGADLNAMDFEGWTPLHLAALRKNLHIAQYLIQGGADVNKEDYERKTPLHYAVKKGVVDVADLLLKSGAAIKIYDIHCRTPYEYAHNKKMKELLESYLRSRGTKLFPISLVSSSINSAIEHYQKGQCERAEGMLESVLDFLNKSLGSSHPYIARPRLFLGMAKKAKGQFGKAEDYLRRSVAVYEQEGRNQSPELARGVYELAELHGFLGLYDKAIPMYNRALSLFEKAYGPEHQAVAIALCDLGRFYQFIGDWDRAQSYYERARIIFKKRLGYSDPGVIDALTLLASLNKFKKNYDKAEYLYMQALELTERQFGPEHPRIGTCHNNLGTFFTLCGRFQEAKASLKKALSIYKRYLVPEDEGILTLWHNLGEACLARGSFPEAESYFMKALNGFEKTFKGDASRLVFPLTSLAVLKASVGEYKEAYTYSNRMMELEEKIIDHIMGLPENQKLGMLSILNYLLHIHLNLAVKLSPEDPHVPVGALNLWLRRKGVILEAQKRIQEALVYSDDPEALKTFQKLSTIRARLSKLTFGGPGKEGAETYKKWIAELEVEKEKLEAGLSQLSHAFAVQKKITKADTEKVAKALPANTALLEFAKIETFNFKAKGKEERWLPARYLAFVLHAGGGDRVGMIDLGDAKKIVEAIEKFKKEISAIKDVKGAIDSSRKIHDLVFEKIKNELGDVKEIFISPDGDLNLIPFEALQGPDGRFLIEDYTFNYLAAGRDVLGFGEIREKAGKVLLMGDPDFDMGEEEKGSALRKLALRNVEGEEVLKRSSDMRGLAFTRLPGTREEVQAVYELYGKDRAELYTGREALEEILMTKGAPGILHLATHGFFLDDLKPGQLRGESCGRGIQMASIAPNPTAGKKQKIENPLRRSGIALAGANNSLKSDDPEKGDGIVTAEKILGLRLRGTDMVVLSACETGLGEVKTGEGVFGLRRAFTRAGAKSLVMSMWSVPDKETKELMIRFYENIRSGKMNRCQALRQAALKQMKLVKDRYGTTNPLYWGAFVFMGEP